MNVTIIQLKKKMLDLSMARHATFSGNFRKPTLEATGVGVALESGQTGADGAVVLDMALSVGTAVAGRHAPGVEAGAVARALVVGAAAHANWEVHCGRGGERSARAKRDSKISRCYRS